MKGLGVGRVVYGRIVIGRKIYGRCRSRNNSIWKV